jgi:mRNA interferase RelE/StbE
MAYEVVFGSQTDNPYDPNSQPAKALKKIRRGSIHDYKRILSKISDLETTPFPPKYRKLAHSGADLYRIRAGDYRVIYSINKNANQLHVLSIKPRDKSYKDLDSLNIPNMDKSNNTQLKQENNNQTALKNNQEDQHSFSVLKSMMIKSGTPQTGQPQPQAPRRGHAAPERGVEL